jgi:hypothetical protein
VCGTGKAALDIILDLYTGFVRMANRTRRASYLRGALYWRC